MPCFIFTVILNTTNVALLTELVVKVIKKKSYHKSMPEKCQFHIFPWTITTNLHEILISDFHGSHCQKREMLCFLKVFQQVYY